MVTPAAPPKVPEGPPDERFRALGEDVNAPAVALAPVTPDRDVLIQSLGALVQLPFTVWARVAKTPEIALTKEETRGGIQSGYALVQALGTTFNPLWFAVAVFAGWGASVTIPRVMKRKTSPPTGEASVGAGTPQPRTAGVEGGGEGAQEGGPPNWEGMK